MLTLLQFDVPVLVVALLIGVATGRWLFRRPAPSRSTDTSMP